MTAARFELPHPMPTRLLTVAEYAALGETEFGYTELLEGRLLMSPSPGLAHNDAMGELFVAIKSALPTGFGVTQDLDLDLEINPPDQPGFVRRPDLIVFHAEARQRIREQGGLLRASDAVLVVEIVSPSSKRTDYHDKRGDYAEAGVPYYWVVDLEPPVSLLACHEAGEFGYADDGEFTGIFRSTQPFPFEFDLDTLV
ncbi:Uma2 family endonuclease [Pseudonocardia eucalypti]|uniref:Uma2 family endonuclease n=1 Tax=Pseudonocardia eucalypti TaxID=648755 RepID=A0ABP9PEP6_9PSEU|nr:Uma2 family endonuclease [Pseudonocardia eucalypti]